MNFKDKRQVAVGVDEKGLYAITAALKIAGQRGIDDVSNSLVYTSLYKIRWIIIVGFFKILY